MRLLHTESLTLKDFAEGKIPKYAILSHTWEEGREVLYQDFGQEKAPSSKAGWSKISGFCEKARELGFSWVWVDTCCIDKSSSTELSEAINSMFRWYQNAAICYVYLTDVTAQDAAEGSKASKPNAKTGRKDLYHLSEFTRSRWFKRGWTLQELISPRRVEFFTLEWGHIGSKDRLAEQLQNRTDIPQNVLRGTISPQRSSVAQRMAWAAGRETTRPEDEAYCLLGLFEIMMQEEDYSLLAWMDDTHDTPRWSCLAPQPGSFQKVHAMSLSHVVERYRTRLCRIRAASMTRGNGARWSPGAVPETEHKVSPDLRALGLSGTESTLGQSCVHTSQFWNHDRREMRPPEMTSRGLRMSLFIRSTEDPVEQCIAWTYCTLFDEPLCIMLEPLKAAHGTVYKRSTDDLLFTVNRSLLGEFSRQEVYLTVRALHYDARRVHKYIESASDDPIFCRMKPKVYQQVPPMPPTRRGDDRFRIE